MDDGELDFSDGYPKSGQTANGFLIGRDILDGLTKGDDAKLIISPANDIFQNWSGKQPNNEGPDDVIRRLSNGLWDDLPRTDTNLDAYLVEYGGLATSPDHQSDPAYIDLANIENVGVSGVCETTNAYLVQSATFTAEDDLDQLVFEIDFSLSGNNTVQLQLNFHSPLVGDTLCIDWGDGGLATNLDSCSASKNYGARPSSVEINQ